MDSKKPEQVVRAIGSPDRIETALAHLAEKLSDEAVAGVVVCTISADGDNDYACFGSVENRDLGFLGLCLSSDSVMGDD